MSYNLRRFGALSKFMFVDVNMFLLKSERIFAESHALRIS